MMKAINLNTYNIENDQVRKTALNPKTAYDEKINTNWHKKKFAMPDVKEGSVIEISYRIKSPYFFTFRNWEFQKAIPVLYSTYTTKMVPFYEYTYILQGKNKFDNFKSYVDTGLSHHFAGIDYQDMVYEYTMNDLPAFRDESFITSANDFIIKLDFQLSALHRPNGSNEAIISTWPKLSEDLIKDETFGKYVKSCQSKSADFIDTMKLSSKTQLEKAKIIERFVKKNFKWNGDNYKLTTKSVKDFLKSKTGSTAEINLFLTGMLNAAGIEANPVLLSTRDHGKIKLNYPFLHFFNSVIVLAKLDTVSVLLDATEPFSNFSEIPTQCINDKGLIIQKGKSDWVNLKSNTVSTKVYHINLHPDLANDSIIQHCKLITSGYEAINYRNKYSESYKNLKDDLQGANSLTKDSLRPVGLNQIENPFEIDFDKKTVLERIEDKIIVSPFGNFTMSENPLKQNARNYPVDIIYKKIYAFETSIDVPKGYKLLSKPESIKINDNMVRIIFSTTEVNNETIKVIGLYEFKKDEYGAVEYLYLKDYFNKIVDKFNEKLVLVKV